MVQIVKGITARQKLELSRLSPKALHREAMGTDVDIDKFKLYLARQVRTDIADKILDASITRTIEGASTLSVTVDDFSRGLLTSGLLSNRLDVELDGLWFRLAAVDKNDDNITLTFEDREVAILRLYNKWKLARRSKITRAEFVLNLIREVREFKIPVFIPELHTVQPVEVFAGDITGEYTILENKSRGIPEDINSTKAGPAMGVSRAAGTTVGTSASSKNDPPVVLRVKRAAATKEQIRNANTILSVGEQMLTGNHHKRKLMVCAIMTAIQESVLINNPGGDNAHGGGPWDSAGLFQQTGDWGSYQERTDPATAARLFFNAAIKKDASEPTVDYTLLCADVQNPREDLRNAYAQWRGEAERFVNAFGVPGGDSEGTAAASNNQYTNASNGSSYVFWRGTIEDRGGNPVRKPENSWSCIQRLADEVDWRAFFVSGTFYFMSEDRLFKQKPYATITEFQEGIRSVNGNYDGNKKSGTVEIKVALGRWEAPVGSVVFLANMGPWTGRWLVSEFSRSLFDTEATVTLKKPRPKLPEPITNNTNGIPDTWYDQPSVSATASAAELRRQVLSNNRISFENDSQKNDIATGQITDQVLEFLLWLVGRGYSARISALKSDHHFETNDKGIPVAHSAGRAVDIDTFNINNPDTKTVMLLIGQYQPQLGFSQLIGPYPELCIPLGIYDQATLSQHKSHIHVGWAL